MEYTFSARLLLVLGAYCDYRKRVSSVSNALAALAGDPRYRQHRQWILRSLHERQKIKHTVYNLRRRHYLQRKVFGASQALMLTPKGEQKIAALRLMGSGQKKLLTGGRWLMVFFDIPEQSRKQRDRLRVALRAQGFEPVQKSVWATRYDVRAELRALLDNRILREHVKFLLVHKQFT